MCDAFVTPAGPVVPQHRHVTFPPLFVFRERASDRTTTRTDTVVFFLFLFLFFFCYISSLLFSIFLVTRLRCPLFILPPPLPPRYEEMRLGFDIPMEFSPNRRFPQPPPTGNSATRNAFSTQCAIYVFRSSRRVARRVRPSARAKG